MFYVNVITEYKVFERWRSPDKDGDIVVLPLAESRPSCKGLYACE